MSIVWVFVIFLVIVIILGKLFASSSNADFISNEEAGVIGEISVMIPMMELPIDVYNVFHGVYVPGRGDSVTEIDHIIVSRFGIFVVETKNYSGHLYGKEEDSRWTQVFNYGRRKIKIGNPLRQNKGHIAYLSRFLNMPMTKFHSIICFTGSAEIMTWEWMPDYVRIDGWDNDYILSFQETLLSKNEERYVVNKIDLLKSDTHLEERHQRYLQRRYNQH